MNKLLVILSCLLWYIPAIGQWQQTTILERGIWSSVPPQWADLDGDGLADMVSYDRERLYLYWQKNLNGTLSEPVSLANNFLLDNNVLLDKLFFLQDYDFDGDVDIIALQPADSARDYTWTVFVNDEQQNFRTTEYLVDNSTIYAGEILAFGDLNGDELMDCVIQRAQTFHLLLARVDGTFDTSIQADATRNKVSIKDLDNDGTSEIIIRQNNHNLNIYRLEEEELLLKEVALLNLNDDWVEKYRQFIDFDNDGDLDILLGIQEAREVVRDDVGWIEYGQTHLYAIMNNGDEGFGINNCYNSNDRNFYNPISGNFDASKPSPPPYIAVGDLDGDSYAELVVFDKYKQVFRLNKDQVYEISQTDDQVLPINHFNNPQIISFKDTEQGTLMAYRNQQDHYAIYPSDTTLNGWDECINCNDVMDWTGLKKIDIDNDGDLDLLVASINNKYQLAWVENIDNACDFITHKILIEKLDISKISDISVAVGDLDGDGTLDIVLKENTESAKIYSLMNEDGNGSFSTKQMIDSVPYGNEIYIEDLNGDEYSEIIVRAGKGFRSYTETNKLYIYHNESGINDLRLEEIPTREVTSDLVFGDIDLDNDLDIISTLIYPSDPFVDWYQNLGDEFNNYEVLFKPVRIPNSISLRDSDKDGPLGVLLQHRGESREECLFLYENQNGTYSDSINLKITCKEDSFSAKPFTDINRDDFFLLNDSKSNDWHGEVSLFGSLGIMETLFNGNAIVDDIVELNNSGGPEIIVADTKGNLFAYSQNLALCIQDNTTTSTYNLVEELIKVYPNPSVGQLHIDSQLHFEMDLYDQNGRLIEHYNNGTNLIYLHHLPAGIYTLKLHNGEHEISKQIIIQN